MRLLLPLLLIISVPSFCQQISFKELQLSSDKKLQGDYKSYISKAGKFYKIGDELTFGMPTRGRMFRYIRETMFLDQMSTRDSYAGLRRQITAITVKGNPNRGMRVFITSNSSPKFSAFAIDFENAIALGEIVNPEPTSDQALVQLKKAKEKLDLQLITQQEYDDIKEELKEFIK